MNREQVLSKIQKCLNLAENNSNENEAKQAISIAYNLMSKYSISEVDIEKQEVITDVDAHDILSRSRRTVEDSFVGSVIDKFFNVRVIWTSQRRGPKVAKCIGTESDAEIAKVVYIYLSRTYRELWHEFYYSLEHRDAKKKKAYYVGLTQGLCERLEAEKKEVVRDKAVGSALMVINNKVAMRTRELFPNLRTQTNRYSASSQALGRGKQDASKIDLKSYIKGCDNKSQVTS